MLRVDVLVFDGDCGFCTRSAAWLARHASSLTVVPWQRADLAALGLTEDQCREAVQLVQGGRRSSGGRAIADALVACDQPYRTAGRLLGMPALVPIVELGYRVVAANRHRLPGGTPACASDSDERSVARVGGHGAGQPVAPADR